MSNNLRQSVESILQDTDVQINGSRPWDIKVKDERFYARVLAHGTLGFGESYMDGWWECDRIDELVSRLLRSDVRSKLKPNFTLVKNAILARALNLQSGR
ncbi:MAG: cyclopropane-fatty-acyl-phospholipid synthase, partial [Patescibacteria group bacterium]